MRARGVRPIEEMLSGLSAAGVDANKNPCPNLSRASVGLLGAAVSL